MIHAYLNPIEIKSGRLALTKHDFTPNHLFKKILDQVFPEEIRNIYSIIFLIIFSFVIVIKSIWPTEIPKDVDNNLEIPAGTSLININALNSDSLDSIIGEKAVVNVYLPNLKGQKPTLLIRQARAVKSSQNSSHFAILVPENKVENLLKYGHDFILTLASPQKSGTEFVNLKNRKSEVLFDVL